MSPRLVDWTASLFGRSSLRQRRPRAGNWRCGPADVLEDRTLLSVTIGPLQNNSLPAGKDELIALPVTNSTQNPVSYSVQSDNANVTASIVTGGRSLAINVTGVQNNVQFNGVLTFRLLESEDPVTTARFIDLVSSGFYTNRLFHRVIQDFVAQGGLATNGNTGTGQSFSDEFHTDLTFTSNGLLAMANSGDDTNDAQFFITDVDLPLAGLPQHLNFQHTIFGVLTSGFDTFRKLMATPTNPANDRPVTDAVINSAIIFNDTQNGLLRVHAAPGFTGAAHLTITANDGQGSTDQEQLTINVVADTVNDRAFLGSIGNVTTNQGTPVTVNVQGIDLENDPLKFVVKTAASFGTDNSTGADPTDVAVSIVVTPASGGTPASAAIKFTPNANFSGTLNLIVGVRDQTQRGGTSIDSRANFDTQAITLTVNPVNHAPTTPGGSTGTPLNQAKSIQLTADDGDPDKTQVLTYEIVTQPAHGTISNFDASTGSLLYTPANNFTGVDTFTYRVRDNGGTANGGTDTSAATTFTVSVGAQTPTGLALAPASDDGIFNDDRVISNATPTFTVNAQAGSVVKFLVNGTSQVTAQETSPGVFTGTLTRQMLQVGANTITATASISGVTSPATSPLTFTYAPSYENVYTVPGAFGSVQQLTFKWNARDFRSIREFGVISVDNPNGEINGLSPDDPGYAAAALASGARQVIFDRWSSLGSTETLNVTGGELLVFYVVANRGPSWGWYCSWYGGGGRRNTYFSVDEANRDGVDHLRVTADSQTGQLLMRWESGRRGGDRDFNDAVISVTPGATASANVAEALRVSGGPAHNVPVTFTLESTRRQAPWDDSPPAGNAQGEFGFFIVQDAAGTVAGLHPGDAGYLQAALGSSTHQVIFNRGDAVGAAKTLQIPGGALIGWYYIPDGTAASLLANNPTNDPDKGPVALLSFDAGNPDSQEHIRWYASDRRWWRPMVPDAGDLQLHVLDRLFSSRSPFDDLSVNISMPV